VFRPAARNRPLNASMKALSIGLPALEVQRDPFAIDPEIEIIQRTRGSRCRPGCIDEHVGCVPPPRLGDPALINPSGTDCQTLGLRPR
jgi:hypothetical protein